MVHNKLVPSGFEFKYNHIKSNMQLKIIKMKTDKCVPYTYIFRSACTHTHNTEGVSVHEIFAKLREHYV